MSVHALSLALGARLPSAAHKLTLVLLADSSAFDGWQPMESPLDADRLAASVGISRPQLTEVLRDLEALGAAFVATGGGRELYWLDIERVAALGSPEEVPA